VAWAVVTTGGTSFGAETILSGGGFSLSHVLVEVDGSDRAVDICGISEEGVSTTPLDVRSNESAGVNNLGGIVTISVSVTIGRIVTVEPGNVTVVVMVALQAVLFPISGNGTLASKTWCPGEGASCSVTSVIAWMQSEQGIALRGDKDTATPRSESVGSAMIAVTMM
jgi:hypothetical protein